MRASSWRAARFMRARLCFLAPLDCVRDVQYKVLSNGVEESMIVQAFDRLVYAGATLAVSAGSAVVNALRCRGCRRKAAPAAGAAAAGSAASAIELSKLNSRSALIDAPGVS
jgi:hypothetical protein